MSRMKLAGLTDGVGEAVLHAVRLAVEDVRHVRWIPTV